MKQYKDLLKYVLNNGIKTHDRTGVGTISTFGYQIRFNLQDGFPIITTKRIPFGLVKSELVWFLNGDSNIKYLLEHNNHIWDEWAFERYVKSKDYHGPDMTNFGIRSEKDEEFNKEYQNELSKFQQKILNDNDFSNKYGDLGNVYGKQWRSWSTKQGHSIDQIANVINQIKTNPNSRRLVVSAWNPEDVPNMALPPCHTLFQFNVHDGKLSCQLYQRSADVFLGVPFNIASYALLTHLIAKEVGLDVGEFIHTLGDTHIYLNHLEQVDLLLSRDVRELPKLIINNDVNMNNLDLSGIKLDGYNPHNTIKAPIAV